MQHKYYNSNNISNTKNYYNAAQNSLLERAQNNYYYSSNASDFRFINFISLVLSYYHYISIKNKAFSRSAKNSLIKYLTPPPQKQL